MMASIFTSLEYFHYERSHVRRALAFLLRPGILILFLVSPVSADIIDLTCELQVLEKFSDEKSERQTSSKAIANVNVLIGKEEILKLNPSNPKPPNIYIKIKFRDVEEGYTDNLNNVEKSGTEETRMTSVASFEEQKISARRTYESKFVSDNLDTFFKQYSVISLNRYSGRVEFERHTFDTQSFKVGNFRFLDVKDINADGDCKRQLLLEKKF